MSRQDDSMTDLDAAVPGSGAVSEGDPTMPLMGGVVHPEGLPDAEGLEAPVGRSGSHLLSSGTLVILAVAAVAAGSLFLMRSTQHPVPTTDKAVEARIEQALVKLSSSKPLDAQDPLSHQGMSALFDNTDRIVSMFTRNTATKQVPLKYLKKDPFVLTITPRMVAVGDSNAAANARMTEELKDLKLEAVMQGRIPVAVINGNLVQPGQRLGNFTVKSISGLSVVLEAGGASYTLKMEEKSDRPTGSFRQMR